MKNIADVMQNFFSVCDIKLDGEIISKEAVLQAYTQFLCETADKKEHNENIILYTGNYLFESLAVAFAAVSNLILNETDQEEVVLSLNDGDTVLYGDKKKSRYIFNGIVKSPFDETAEVVKLLSGEKDVTYVPQKRWRLIEPYHGTSKKLSGIGIKRTSGIRDVFFEEVLGYKKEEIPNVIKTSSIIVINRAKADQIVGNLSFVFNDKEAELLELVTASYYSGLEEERFYRGNNSKSEPVLKLCSRLSIARDFLRNKEGNSIIGVFVFGNDVISNGLEDLPHIMRRKFLRYCSIGVQSDAVHVPEILNLNETAGLFACTKDFLLSVPSCEPVCPGRHVNSLYRKINNIIDQAVDIKTFTGPLDAKKYKSIRSALLSLRNVEEELADIDNFVVQAFSLANLFSTALFSMKELEEAIDKGIVRDIAKPGDKLKQLAQYSAGFPAEVKQIADAVTDTLYDAYSSIFEISAKEDYLKSYISENRYKYIAVVVPKAYYASVMRDCGYYDLMSESGMLVITTAGRFDTEGLYDTLIIDGDITANRFDPLLSTSSENKVFLTADYDSKYLKYRMKQAKEAERLYNIRSTVKFDFDNETFDELTVVLSDEEIRQAKELKEYISELSNRVTVGDIRHSSYGYADAETEVVAAAVFENGERGYFTKYYRPYVVDENTGNVKEISIEELSEGDSVIFTVNNSRTRDVVDSVMTKFESAEALGRVSPQFVIQYALARDWKPALRKYMTDNNLSYSELTDRLRNEGASVQEIAIRNWLDIDSHIVGPRAPESMQAICNVVGSEMLGTAQEYFDACSSVRKLRMNILKDIGEAIMDKYNNKAPDPGSLLTDIYDQIDDLAVVLRVERVFMFEEPEKAPAAITNRPHAI